MIDWFCEKWKKLFYKKIEENSIKAKKEIEILKLMTSGTYVIEPKSILSKSELENLEKEVHKLFNDEREKNTIMVLNTGMEVRYINPIPYDIKGEKENES
jgi:hypothetical protein